MELVALRCNNCGASLEVNERARFVTCGYCHNQLMVTHTSEAIYTEVLDQLAEQSGQMAGNLKVIALQNHLERLDREWMVDLEKYSTKGTHAFQPRPDRGATLAGTIVGALFVIGWIVGALQMSAPVLFPLFGVFVLIIIGYNCVSSAEGREQVEAAYLVERATLVEKISAARESSP